MRLALCTQQFGDYWSGLGSYATLLARGLVEAGVELTVLTPGDALESLKADTIKVHPGKLDPTHGGWFSLSRAYQRELKKLDVDLIHFSDAREAYAYRGEIPALGTLHDDYFARHRWVPWFYQKQYVDWIQRYLYYSFVTCTERRAIRRLDGLIANSDCTGRTISKRYGIDPKSMQRIYIQPDLRVQPLTEGLEEKRLQRKTLLFVGGNIQRKGLPLVFDALKLLLPEYPEIELTILGRNQNLVKMQKIAEKMGIANHVHIEGWVPPEEIAGYYRESSMFIMPSVMEGYGLVYLEAMAQGLPVIAGNVGGTRELIRHSENGLLVDPADSEALAQSIQSLLQDQELRHRLIAGGYKTVEAQQVQEMVNNTMSFYSKVISEHRTR
ncbi:MAG: glycosyltransferase family 4 protein [Candidatus Marinimicrobia bacterium]|nr:glycosyltransferase family 4 protein [Candidatus Neomarinimicrobiota bacterium]MCF7905352.1 glycosyltransferase family 4 protein [Candidatus Neomarinimicrobiota bacterium]